MKSLQPRRQLALLAATSTLFLSGLALAQSTGGPSGAETTPPGASKAPEQAAIDACSSPTARLPRAPKSCGCPSRPVGGVD